MNKDKHKIRFTRPENRDVSLLKYIDKEAFRKQDMEWFLEDAMKLYALCEEYKIKESPHMFQNLSLALAREFLPEPKKGGNKKKWSIPISSCLVAELERVCSETGKTQLDAAKYLAKTPSWKGFLKPDSTDPAEALLAQYKKHRKNVFADLARYAHKQCKEQNNEVGWKNIVKQALLASK